MLPLTARQRASPPWVLLVGWVPPPPWRSWARHPDRGQATHWQVALERMEQAGLPPRVLQQRRPPRRSGLWGLWPARAAPPARCPAGSSPLSHATAEAAWSTAAPSPRSPNPQRDAAHRAIRRRPRPVHTGHWRRVGALRSAPEPYRAAFQWLPGYSAKRCYAPAPPAQSQRGAPPHAGPPAYSPA